MRPIFPFGQWLVLSLGIIRGPKTTDGVAGRQPFVLGVLQQGVTLEDATRHLTNEGFFQNRVAFHDPGQILSMRRLSDEHPECQYHIRIFDDGEVRGHYEYTPEDHPIQHMDEAIFEPRTETFKAWVGTLLKETSS